MSDIAFEDLIAEPGVTSVDGVNVSKCGELRSIVLTESGATLAFDGAHIDISVEQFYALRKQLGKVG